MGTRMKSGTTLGRFRIEQKLAVGQMSSTYLGFDPSMQAMVIIKVLFDQLASDPIAVARFTREATILKALDHPHIIKLIESCQGEFVHYIVLEHVQGELVSNLLRSHHPLPIDRSVKLVKQLGSALAAAHARDIIHRDIRPENLLVQSTTNVLKILDFGVARTDDALLQTSTGKFVGTLQYAAPEQMQGGPVDPRADIYAVGLVFYELLTGRSPIVPESAGAILDQQLADDYPPPSTITPAVPQELDRIVAKLLRADKDRRYHRVQDFLHDLEIFEGERRTKVLCTRTLEKFPELEPQYHSALAAMEAREHDKALALAEELVAKAPKAPELVFLLGEAFMAKGALYKGVREYANAAKLDPWNVYYRLNLACAYEAINLSSEAQAEYETALELNPESEVARRRLDALKSVPPRKPIREPAPRIGTPPPPERTVSCDPERMKYLLDLELRSFNPAVKDRVGIAARTMISWGWGYRELGLPALSREATRAQWITASATTLLTLIGLTILAHSGSGTTALLQIPLVSLVAYAAASLHQTLKAMDCCDMLAQQGRLLSTPDDHDMAEIDLGSDRCVEETAVFNVYRETQRGSHQGALIGWILVQHIALDKCWGKYERFAKEAPSVGDYAVLRRAVKAGLLSPETPHAVPQPAAPGGGVPITGCPGLESV
jgi:tetratricopeptide (TPR) repeat protein